MEQKKIEQAIRFLEQEFGPEWKTIVATLGTQFLTKRNGKELTSFMAFPERGSGGSSSWRGNCSPEVIASIVQYVMDEKRYYGKDVSQFTLMAPMSGSGTSADVAQKLGIRHKLYDLNPNPRCGKGGWNALKDEVEDSADVIFFHPPYHSIIQYSGNVWGKPHPDDLSRCENYQDFLEKLNLCIRKFFMALRNDGRLAILVGDVRQKDAFFSMQKDVMRMGAFESFLVKGQFHCVSDERTYKKPFIPIVTEYMLVYHKESPIIVPFTWCRESVFDLRKQDFVGVTWHHLIRSIMEAVGGVINLKELYIRLQDHPKTLKNPHYKERIRATLHEHPEEYIPMGDGSYRLSYSVA